MDSSYRDMSACGSADRPGDRVRVPGDDFLVELELNNFFALINFASDRLVGFVTEANILIAN
jgi:hypothetical protein